jgi:phytoene dehydrogenase-like protein
MAKEASDRHYAASDRHGTPGPENAHRGLHLVGHWTQPGHGVLTAVLSGLQAARRIMGG